MIEPKIIQSSSFDRVVYHPGTTEHTVLVLSAGHMSVHARENYTKLAQLFALRGIGSLLYSDDTLEKKNGVWIARTFSQEVSALERAYDIARGIANGKPVGVAAHSAMASLMHAVPFDHYIGLMPVNLRTAIADKRQAIARSVGADMLHTDDPRIDSGFVELPYLGKVSYPRSVFRDLGAWPSRIAPLTRHGKPVLYVLSEKSLTQGNAVMNALLVKRDNIQTVTVPLGHNFRTDAEIATIDDTVNSWYARRN